VHYSLYQSSIAKARLLHAYPDDPDWKDVHNLRELMQLEERLCV